MKRLVYVINGPNLNLLGKRQPAIYGQETLADVEIACRRVATESHLELEFRQSNREYEIIDWIHEARETAAGVVINPAAFKHTSIAILDALNAFDGPVFEIHIRMFTNGRPSGTILIFQAVPTASSRGSARRAIHWPCSDLRA
jgi:3-dehydroquinate dehydratase-2